MTVDLSITVLHFNRWDLTKDCLASIDAQDIPCSYEKVLVDNGSTETWDAWNWPKTKADSPFWRIVRYEENKGHIVGQNRCFESAQGEWVLFVANDVRLHPRCISDLWMTASRSDVRPGQIQPQLFTGHFLMIDHVGMDWRWPGYGISRTSLFSSFPVIIPSTCYLMHHETWKTLGGFDEHLLTSHEDVDMGLRLRQAGCVNTVQPHATAIHLGNATLRYQPSHNRAAFHRDRVYVIKKHYRGLDRWARLAAVNFLDSLPKF